MTYTEKVHIRYYVNYASSWINVPHVELQKHLSCNTAANNQRQKNRQQAPEDGCINIRNMFSSK